MIPHFAGTCLKHSFPALSPEWLYRTHWRDRQVWGYWIDFTPSTWVLFGLITLVLQKETYGNTVSWFPSLFLFFFFNSYFYFIFLTTDFWDNMQLCFTIKLFND